MTKKSATYRIAHEFARRAEMKNLGGGSDFITYRADCRALLGDWVVFAVHVSDDNPVEHLAKRLVSMFGGRT